jgi:DNA-binding MarR family transcriptional regulator
MNADRDGVKDLGPLVEVPADFEQEFPDGSAAATAAFLNLGVLTGSVRTVVEGFFQQEGLTSFAAFNVLSVLDGAGEPIQPSVLAARMMVTRATMTGLVDSLERRGLVERRRTEADARHRLVGITAEGTAIARRLVPRLHRFERELMTCLGDEELRLLLAMVGRLQHRLHELAPQVTPGIR